MKFFNFHLMPYRLTHQPRRIESVLVHLGYDVRMARLTQFQTQPRMSERFGIGQSTWSMVECGLARASGSPRLKRPTSPSNVPPPCDQMKVTFEYRFAALGAPRP